jgi:hypothetical protein
MVSGLLVVPTSRLEKLIDFRDKDTAVAPLPPKFTVWVPVPALSVTVRAALIEPVVGGVKVTVNARNAPTARRLPQLLDWVK